MEPLEKIVNTIVLQEDMVIFALEGANVIPRKPATESSVVLVRIIFFIKMLVQMF